jgi:hypothetical protein
MVSADTDANGIFRPPARLRHRSLHGCLAHGCSCVVVLRFAEAAAHGGMAGGTAGAWRIALWLLDSGRIEA